MSAVKKLLKTVMTERQIMMLRAHRRLRDSINRVPSKARNCNICGFEGLFDLAGWPLRIDANCPRCGSLERHRLFRLWLANNIDAVRDRDVLHFAPEGFATGFLKPLAHSYVNADLEMGRADIVLDIEKIDLASSSLDTVICSHVLEHVDDRKALAELFRILRPGGLCILMVPLVEGWDTTFEDPNIKDPKGRAIYFGQDDHVRYYGADFRDRVRDAGFTLTEFTAVEPFVTRHALQRGDKVFVARRPD
ncbi:methyltransferase domain-containing protein [Rhodomicrobium sp. Az07]|uniref:methyltransferase domain-containing protein n=1 Tax=Rhodomicrobium sp. Az07 TaxID=2839034 RepID=UPI001BEAF9A7|nr:class I SAM-dependent methyltransferase [Rhodomicrobium sp. Az07]MBT3069587.1 methyltransferase domain-containing protein [Rhodomicrobium sp. Az07]